MGLFKGIGGIINNITGVSSSAKAGYNYSSALAGQQNAYQKEFAQNAHQWEMEDLKRAGLNPALTATGGSGASAGGAGGGGTINPGAGGLGILGEIAGIFNNTRATSANNELQGAQTIKTIAETKAIPEYVQNDLIKALAAKMSAEANNADKKGGISAKILGTRVTEWGADKYNKWEKSDEGKKMKNAKNAKEAWENIFNG